LVASEGTEILPPGSAGDTARHPGTAWRSNRTSDAHVAADLQKGNAVVYVVQQSQLLKEARGSALHRAMLATVLWHAMAHLSGVDERAARKAAETLWMQFVRDGLADQVTGLRYLGP
jgi:hypothetical protein